jgi:hypothetical protein
MLKLAFEQGTSEIHFPKKPIASEFPEEKIVEPGGFRVVAAANTAAFAA